MLFYSTGGEAVNFNLLMRHNLENPLFKCFSVWIWIGTRRHQPEACNDYLGVWRWRHPGQCRAGCAEHDLHGQNQYLAQRLLSILKVLLVPTFGQ